MERIPQSTAKRVALKAYLASDHVSAATGKTIPVTISKNGGAFGNPNAGATNATEIASGWYYVNLDATDTGTNGPLIVRGTHADIDPTELVMEVCADLATLTAALTTIDDFLDTEIAAIKAKTDNLPTDPADQSAVETAITALGVTVLAGVPTATENADALLKRDMSAVTGEADRSPLNAIRFLRNKWSLSGTTLTVTKEDDATSAWTATVTTSAGADPIVGNDPA